MHLTFPERREVSTRVSQLTVAKSAAIVTFTPYYRISVFSLKFVIKPDTHQARDPSVRSGLNVWMAYCNGEDGRVPGDVEDEGNEPAARSTIQIHADRYNRR